MSLLDNLISWWTLNSNGNDGYDSHNLSTYSGSPSYASGKVGNAVSCLLGASLATGSFSLGSTTDMTLAGWFYFPSDAPDEDWIIHTTNYRMAYNGTSMVFTSIKGADTSSVVQNGIPLNEWVFIVAKMSGTTLSISKNNGTPVTTSRNANLLNDAGELYVGNPSYVTGAIRFDELALWSRALSAGEISTLYNSGSGMTYSSLVQTVTPDAAEATSETYIPTDAVTIGTPKALHTRKTNFSLNIRADELWFPQIVDVTEGASLIFSATYIGSISGGSPSAAIYHNGVDVSSVCLSGSSTISNGTPPVQMLPAIQNLTGGEEYTVDVIAVVDGQTKNHLLTIRCHPASREYGPDSLYVAESPIALVSGEQPIFSLTWTGKSEGSAPSAKIYRNGIDVTASNMSGSSTISGATPPVQMLPAISGLIGGERYVVVATATVDGNTEPQKLLINCVLPGRQF